MTNRKANNFKITEQHKIEKKKIKTNENLK